MEGYVPISRLELTGVISSEVGIELGFKARGYANFCMLCPKDPECHPRMGVDVSGVVCDLPRNQYWVPEHVPMILKIHRKR